MLKQWCRKIERLLIARFVVNISAKNCQNHVDLCSLCEVIAIASQRCMGRFLRHGLRKDYEKILELSPLLCLIELFSVLVSCFYSRVVVFLSLCWVNMNIQHRHLYRLLWPPYGIGQAIIFLPCGFFFYLLLFRFFSPNLSGRRVDVCHTSTHGVALVRI